MAKSTLRERFDRASAILANTEYTIDATLKTDMEEVVIVPHFMGTVAQEEIAREFNIHMYSSMFGGFVVSD